MGRILYFVGSIAVDTLLDVSAFPPEDSKVKLIREPQIRLGGNAANAAVVSASLGFSAEPCDWRVALVAPVVRDSPHHDWILRHLASYSILTSSLVLRESTVDHPVCQPTSHIVRDASKGTRTILSHRVLDELRRDEVRDRVEANESTQHWVHFEGRAPHETLAMMKSALEMGHIVSLELERPRAAAADGADERALLWEAAPHLVVFSSQWIRERGFSRATLRETIDALLASAPTTAPARPRRGLWVFPIGAQGSAAAWVDAGARPPRLADSSEMVRVESVSFNNDGSVVDSVGAGDTFIGALLTWLAAKPEFLEATRPERTAEEARAAEALARAALEFGNKVAGFKVAHEGLSALKSTKFTF